MPIKKRLEELSYLKVEHDAQIMYIKRPPFRKTRMYISCSASSPKLCLLRHVDTAHASYILSKPGYPGRVKVRAAIYDEGINPLDIACSLKNPTPSHGRVVRRESRSDQTYKRTGLNLCTPWEIHLFEVGTENRNIDRLISWWISGVWRWIPGS